MLQTDKTISSHARYRAPLSARDMLRTFALCLHAHNRAPLSARDLFRTSAKFTTFTGKLRLNVSKATFGAKLKNSKALQCCFFCVGAKRFFALLLYLMFTAQQKKKSFCAWQSPLKLPPAPLLTSGSLSPKCMAPFLWRHSNEK